MKKREKIIEDIVAWAQNESRVKAIILEGSMGSDSAKDEFSDYDINLFADDSESFIESDEWFEQFDEIIVFQKEGTYYKNTFIPTRLVIYQNSPRVDFSFWPISILEDWVKNKELPEFYKNGYKILLDKMGITDQLIKPTNDGFITTKPTQDQFLQTIYNFYFEASIIAKYLYRKNLWFAAKLSSGPLKDFLQQMLMWQAAEKENWNLPGMNSLGKNMEEMIQKDIRKKLKKTFSVYELNECWQSLFSMIDLFDLISKELFIRMEIDFPDEKIENIIDY
ncbi:aminoglycoside 6-adenylyltransferase, partial [Candidatus Cloacimonadota bacterium]